MAENYAFRMKDESLSHHGIEGQKWGVRNGPPYPLGSGQHSKAEVRAMKKTYKQTKKTYYKKGKKGNIVEKNKNLSATVKEKISQHSNEFNSLKEAKNAPYDYLDKFTDSDTFEKYFNKMVDDTFINRDDNLEYLRKQMKLPKFGNDEAENNSIKDQIRERVKMGFGLYDVADYFMEDNPESEVTKEYGRLVEKSLQVQSNTRELCRNIARECLGPYSEKPVSTKVKTGTYTMGNFKGYAGSAESILGDAIYSLVLSGKY